MAKKYNVLLQLAPSHQIGLAHFAVEISRRLVEFLEGVGEEGLIVRHLAAVEIAKPAGLENPNGLLVVPMSAGRIDAPTDLERRGGEVEDIEVAEDLTIG